MTEINRIIQTGDRADLKKWLTQASPEELLANWVKLSACRVQDFSELAMAEMRRRGIV